MKALEIQKHLNKEYAKSNSKYPLLLDLYNKMNEQRLIEGIPYLTLPNLEKQSLKNAINN